MKNHIPIIDFSPMLSDCPEGRAKVAEEVDHCAREVGFMYLKNFGIAPETIEAMKATAKRFFANEVAFKKQFGFNQDLNFGYHGVGTEALDPTKPKDQKETFTMRDVAQLGHEKSIWPSAIFQQVIHDFNEDCKRLADRLMAAVAIALELPEGFFTDRHTGTLQTLRLLHYPPSDEKIDGQLGAGAHTDYGTLTLLFQDDSGGLEVQDQSGKWIPAPPVEGAVVINTGDLLERWTNNAYKSTPHRVQVRPAAARNGRLSIAFFSDPDPNVIVEALPACVSEDNPAKYPPISAENHILEKIAATN